MQAFQLFMIGSGALLAIAWLMTRDVAAPHSDRAWSRALVGVVPGVIGAMIILVFSMDLLPDDLEDGAWHGIAIVISAIAVIATTYHLRRR